MDFFTMDSSIIPFSWSWTIHVFVNGDHHPEHQRSGWWLSPTPLKNMTSSVGYYSQYMEKIFFVPNHQPEDVLKPPTSSVTKQNRNRNEFTPPSSHIMYSYRVTDKDESAASGGRCPLSKALNIEVPEILMVDHHVPSWNQGMSIFGQTHIFKSQSGKRSRYFRPMDL